MVTVTTKWACADGGENKEDKQTTSKLCNGIGQSGQIFFCEEQIVGNSLAVQRLGLLAFTAEGAGLIPGRGTKIPQAAWHGQKINK